MERLKSSIISQETETDKALTPEKILAKTTPRQDDDKKYLEEINERIKSLPLKEKLKAIALSSIYQERKKLEEELENKIREYTLRYEQKYIPLYTQANQIIDGSRIPSAEELKGQEQFLTNQEQIEKNNALDASAFPHYWATVFRNCDLLAHEIKEKDDPVFNHLTKVEYKKLENNLDFSIRFHFDKNNPFFKNILLEKTFIMQDEETPLKSKGTAIEWKEEKNLTQKLVKRKQKNKKTGHTKIIERVVDDESFFLFFKNVFLDENINTNKEEYAQDRMNIDFDIARIIIDDLIPFSLEYYLGMVVDNDEESEEEDEEWQDNAERKNSDQQKFSFSKKSKKSHSEFNFKFEKDSNYSETSNKKSPNDSKIISPPKGSPRDGKKLIKNDLI